MQYRYPRSTFQVGQGPLVLGQTPDASIAQSFDTVSRVAEQHRKAAQFTMIGLLAGGVIAAIGQYAYMTKAQRRSFAGWQLMFPVIGGVAGNAIGNSMYSANQ